MQPPTPKVPGREQNKTVTGYFLHPQSIITTFIHFLELDSTSVDHLKTERDQPDRSRRKRTTGRGRIEVEHR